MDNLNIFRDLRNTGITEIPSDLFKLKGLSYL